MRITNTTMARNYSSGLNRNLERLNKANVSVSTGRRFETMAESPSRAVRSMSVRRSLDLLEGYTDNAKSSLNKFTAAETNLAHIATMTQDIYARLNYAINGTNSATERDIIANEFERLQAEILSSANGQYGERYMFGGTNTDSLPFTTNTDGDLMYNGVRVKDIMSGDPQYDHLFNDVSYVDVGLGLEMRGNSQEVIASSAFKNTINGLDIMGFGPNNAYDTITEIINTLREDSQDAGKLGALLDRIKECSDNVNLQRTRVGADSQYLEFTVSRLETDNFNLVERQDELEIIDPAEAIMDFTMQQYVYNAALQMGSRLLQPTIFSFIS